MLKLNSNLLRLNPIIASKEYTYLDQVLKEFPTNCLLHKGKTGCGGTEMVLKDKNNIIIAVPTKDLIKNKIEPGGARKERRDYILGVMEGISDYDIKEYLSKYEVKKIMVTYDSLSRVIKAINSTGENAYKDYFLIVDEYHRLFLDYDFRYTAIRKLLDEAPKFDKVTFMTATPVDDYFMLDELQKYPIQEIKWEGFTPVNVVVERANYVDRRVCEQILWFSGKMYPPDIHYHYFVNSIKFISRVIRTMKLPPKEARVICANTDDNKKKLPDGFEISPVSSPVKKFNFYTSTVFEGSDIYDKNGITIVVSDTITENRIVDISTSMIQIFGRIRDSGYKDQMFYICPITSKETIPLKEYIDIIESDMNEIEEKVNKLNKYDEKQRISVLELLPSPQKEYIIVVDSKLKLDKNKFRLNIYKYKKKCEILASNQEMQELFQAKGYDVPELSETFIKYKDYPSPESPKKKSSKPQFKTCFNEYLNLVKPSFDSMLDELLGVKQQKLASIEQACPLVKEAYEKLGEEKVKELNYSKREIQKYLNRKEYLINPSVMVNILTKYTTLPCEKRVAEWNEILENIYHKYLGLSPDIKAYSTDLNKWFLTRKETKKIDGKNCDVITVISPKLLDLASVKEVE